MARVLVTGGSGFIGSVLAERLLDHRHDVALYDKARNVRHSKRTIIGDVRDLQPLADAIEGADVVFHLAALHRPHVQPPSVYWEENVHGTRNVVEACRRNKCNRLIFTSSAAVYPIGAGPRDETCSPAPSSPYGQSKWAAERIVNEWAEEDPTVHLTIIRPCVVFGENNRGNVYRLMRQIHRNRYVQLGNGKYRKSICYVENLVSFMLACMARRRGPQVFNYTDSPNLSVRDIVTIVQDALGKNSSFAGLCVPYALALLAAKGLDAAARTWGQQIPVHSTRVKKLCVDSELCAKRVRETGFEAPYSLHDALVRTVHHEFPDSARSLSATHPSEVEKV